jgi:hypothetical protein
MPFQRRKSKKRAKRSGREVAAKTIMKLSCLFRGGNNGNQHTVQGKETLQESRTTGLAFTPCFTATKEQEAEENNCGAISSPGGKKPKK